MPYLSQSDDKALLTDEMSERPDRIETHKEDTIFEETCSENSKRNVVTSNIARETDTSTLLGLIPSSQEEQAMTHTCATRKNEGQALSCASKEEEKCDIGVSAAILYLTTRNNSDCGSPLSAVKLPSLFLNDINTNSGGVVVTKSEEMDGSSSYEMALSILPRQELVGGSEAIADAFLHIRHVELIGRGLRTTNAAEYFMNATHLYLQENSLEDLEGLQLLSQLQILVLHHNRIKTVRPLNVLENLIYLDVSHNAITQLDPSQDFPCSSLRYVNLLGNPCCPFVRAPPHLKVGVLPDENEHKNQGKKDVDIINEYRLGIFNACPYLEILDDVQDASDSGGVCSVLELSTGDCVSPLDKSAPHSPNIEEADSVDGTLFQPVFGSNVDTMDAFPSWRATPRGGKTDQGKPLVCFNKTKISCAWDLQQSPLFQTRTLTYSRAKARLMRHTQHGRAQAPPVFSSRPLSKGEFTVQSVRASQKGLDDSASAEEVINTSPPSTSDENASATGGEAKKGRAAASSPPSIIFPGTPSDDEERLLAQYASFAEARRDLLSQRGNMHGGSTLADTSGSSPPRLHRPEFDHSCNYLSSCEGCDDCNVQAMLIAEAQRHHRKLYKDINFSNEVASNRLKRLLEDQWSSAERIMQTNRTITEERKRRLHTLFHKPSLAYEDSLRMLQEESKCADINQYR